MRARTDMRSGPGKRGASRLPPETPRLRLVMPREAHRVAHEAFCASDRSHAGMTDQDAGDFAALVRHHEVLGYGPFVAELKEDGQAIGVFGPLKLDSQPDPEIVFLIWNAANEGRGLGYEAAVATRAFAHWVLGWRSAVSYIAPGNARATRLAIRLGALRDGVWVTPKGNSLQVWRHPDPEAA
ncbi:GNAT family N-acetyltransferase [Histidinibacterium aquaticum]|uniref:GNAT family N-acetyltransferase n=1 Tax=Histidinibacterium aquaticum TaxID=2613962 RepID=A0A5J5GT81_9RHOB|nr:GNAT family protein [Histidinibacterium aquaticum]KAA9010592.1 GNAT family N-acetyltransferase [Histidinibacterium aquaticum]